MLNRFFDLFKFLKTFDFTRNINIKFLRYVKRPFNLFVHKNIQRIELRTGYKIYEFQDALVIGSLSLIILKLALWLSLNFVPHPIINLSIFSLFSILALRYNFMLYFRERLLIPYLASEYGLGFNFYREDVYGPTPDFVLRRNYKRTKMGSIQFWSLFLVQFMIRKCYIFLIAIRLLFLNNPVFFILFQQLLFVFLIFSGNRFLMLFLLLCCNLSRIIFYLSDFNNQLLFTYLKEEVDFKLENNEKIAITLNNIYWFTFWSVRTVEDRDVLLRSGLYCFGDQYMENRTYYYQMENYIYKNKTNWKSIVLFFILLIIIFVGLNAGQSGSFLGYYTKYSVLSKFAGFKKSLRHFTEIKFNKLANGDVKLSFLPFSSEYPNQLYLNNQFRTPVGTHMCKSEGKTTLPLNVLSIIVSESEFYQIKLEGETNLAKEARNEVDYFSDLAESNHVKDILQQQSIDCIVANRVEPSLQDLLNNTFHINSSKKLPLECRSKYNRIFSPSLNTKERGETIKDVIASTKEYNVMYSEKMLKQASSFCKKEGIDYSNFF